MASAPLNEKGWSDDRRGFLLFVGDGLGRHTPAAVPRELLQVLGRLSSNAHGYSPARARRAPSEDLDSWKRIFESAQASDLSTHCRRRLPVSWLPETLPCLAASLRLPSATVGRPGEVEGPNVGRME